MKKNLLLLAATMAAVSLSMQAQCYLAFRGKATVGDKQITGNFTNNIANMAPFTYNNVDGTMTVTIDELQTGTGGFKILINDTELIDKITEEFNGGNTSWKASTWHTMYGADVKGGGLVSLDKDAEPIKLVRFYDLNKETGHSPGEIQFAGGVKTAKNVKLTFYPESGMLSAEGEPVEYKDFGIACASNKWGAPAGDYLFKHEGNGIYSGTINFTDDMLAADQTYKTFKIRPVTNTKPIYGFAKDDSNSIFGKTESITRSEEEMKQFLTGYHIDSEKRREPGVGSGSANTSVTLPATIKAQLDGKYNVRFDSNTGELTLSQDPGGATGVDEIEVDADAPVEYYNIQGIRVENPENGVFIRRQGNNVSKVIVRL